MASNLAKMKDKLIGLSIVGVLLLVHAAYSQEAYAQGSADSGNQYEWSAELVSFDQSSGIATLKARMDARADRSVLAELSEGDEITITWTGLTWGAGIAAVSRGSSADSKGRLHMPAEFVGSEMDDIYLVFRVPVPQGSRAKVEALKPGVRTSPAAGTAASSLARCGAASGSASSSPIAV